MQKLKEKVIIIGSGGHCKVILDILLENNEYEIAGLIDKNSNIIYGINVIGNDTDLTNIYHSGINRAFVAIGNNETRKTITKYLLSIGYDIINVISKHAIISKRANLGSGVAVMPGAIINADTIIGDGCIINTASHIDHDCTVGEFTHIAPSAGLCGSVAIGKNCFICMGSKIIERKTIGDNVIVGAGAVVLCDILACNTVMGVPAKVKENIN